MNPDGTQAGSAHPAPEERATLFFDLDGTLIDSQVGITTCIAYALQKMEHPVPARETLLGWIGPSLRTTFAPLFIEPARVEQAVGYYRERFDAEGWREHTVYPQVEDALRTLHARGHRLAVVTAKNEPHARRILAHLPFGGLFEDIIGSTLDGSRSHKPELVGEALRRLQVSPTQCWMIGDRRMDIEGARHHGLRSIGVLWGFGGEAELTEAGAGQLAREPVQLTTLLARRDRAPCAGVCPGDVRYMSRRVRQHKVVTAYMRREGCANFRALTGEAHSPCSSVSVAPRS